MTTSASRLTGAADRTPKFLSEGQAADARGVHNAHVSGLLRSVALMWLLLLPPLLLLNALQERVQKVKLLLPEAYALHQENCNAVQDIFGRFASSAAGW
jgi:hypothetical protein